MIKKILKIKNIGRYSIDSCHDNYSLDKKTVIFGPNKTGKTTLTEIFESLKDDDKNKILGRKSFGTSLQDTPMCEILYDDSKKKTFDKDWTDSNIEIFDNTFIERNVFTGSKIEQAHKVELHKILIGEDNQKKKEVIDEEEESYGILQTEKQELRDKLGRFFEDFIRIPIFEKAQDWEAKIKENGNKQAQLSNEVALIQMKNNTKLAFDFSHFESNIQQNIDTSLESKIKEHIDNNWKTSEKDFEFIKSGVEKISPENKCPFCGQSLEEVQELIQTFTKFFNPIYKNTQEAINEAIKSLQELDVEKEVAQFKALGFTFKTAIDIDRLKNDYNKVLEIVEEKQKDLSLETKILDSKEYCSLKEEVEKLYSEVENISIESIDKQILEKEESILRLKKYRFSEEGEEVFKKYQNNEKLLKTVKKNIDQLNKELNEEVNTDFEEYMKEINDVLKSSGANFEIKKFSSITDRKFKESYYCDYNFVFDDAYSVELNGSDDQPQFKNTLSDSDKRVLAFAFFIAKLRKDPNMSNKIIILDDPFTTLDDERRDSMINILNGLQCEQIIMLSHSRSFVKRFVKLVGKCNVKTLRLKDISGYIQLRELDIDEDNDFLEILDQKIKDLEEADETTIDSAYDGIRVIIEHVVKIKYKKELNPDNNEIMLPMRYFGRNDCKSPMKKKIGENDYQEHHHDGSNQPSPEELLQKRDYFLENILPQI